jgi:phospholipid transport system substrate-binding protein
VRALLLLITLVAWSTIFLAVGMRYALVLAAIGGALQFIPLIGPLAASRFGASPGERPGTRVADPMVNPLRAGLPGRNGEGDTGAGGGRWCALQGKPSGRNVMVKHHTRVICTLLILLPLGAVQHAWAGPPTDQLRAGVDRVIAILRDPGLAGDKQVIPRRAAISKVAAEIFDFGEMAKRSLGQHWERRTGPERQEFVRLFTDLIERSYISKVDQHAAAATMIYGAETVDGNYAVVQTTVPLAHGDTLPLAYRMYQTDGRWRVYDLSIDGVSLVANYRAQFNRIVRTASYDELVARLKSNQADFSAPSGTSPGGKTER